MITTHLPRSITLRERAWSAKNDAARIRSLDDAQRVIAQLALLTMELAGALELLERERGQA